MYRIIILPICVLFAIVFLMIGAYLITDGHAFHTCADPKAPGCNVYGYSKERGEYIIMKGERAN